MSAERFPIVAVHQPPAAAALPDEQVGQLVHQAGHDVRFGVGAVESLLA